MENPKITDNLEWKYNHNYSEKKPVDEESTKIQSLSTAPLLYTAPSSNYSPTSATKLSATKPINDKSPIDTKKVSAIWDKVADLYEKEYPEYEKIRVIHNGKEVFFKDLSPDQKIELLREGARGYDKEEVEDLAKNYNPNDPNFQQEKFDEEVKKLLRVSRKDIGEFGYRAPKYHKGDHAVREALILEAIALTYRESFEEFSDLTDEEIEDAVIAALFHDCMRQADGIDVFDDLSAKHAEETLRQNFPKIGERRIARIKNAILNKDVGFKEKDRVTVLLHEADCIEFMRIDSDLDMRYLDCCNESYEADKPSFNFKPKKEINLSKVRENVLSLIIKESQLLNRSFKSAISEFPSKTCSLGKNLYEVYYNGVAKDIDLLNVNNSFFGDNTKPRDEVSFLGKINLDEVTPERIKILIEENKVSELFRHENAFEISEKVLDILNDEAFAGSLSDKENFEHTKAIISSCLDLKEDGWTEKFSQRTTFYRLQMAERSMFKNIPQSGGVSYDTHESKNENHLDLENKGRYLGDLKQFMNAHGGNWLIQEGIMASQIASSLSPLLIMTKVALSHFNKDLESAFYPDNRKPDSDETIVKTHKKDSFGSLLSDENKGHDLGGPEGRENLYKFLRNMPDQFWKEAMASYIERTAYAPVTEEKLKEQIMCAQAEELVQNINNSMKNEESLEKYRKDLDKLISKIENRIQKTEENYPNLKDLEEGERDFQNFWEEDKERAKILQKVKTFKDELGKIDLSGPTVDLKDQIDKVSERITDIRAMIDKKVSDNMGTDARFYFFDNFHILAEKFAKKLDTTTGQIASDSDSSTFEETLFMSYAANQEILYNLVRNKSLELIDGKYITLVRQYTKESIENSFQPENKSIFNENEEIDIVSGTSAKLKNVSVFDSTTDIKDTRNPWFGKYVFNIKVPLWRIWGSFYIQTLAGEIISNDSGHEREFTAILNGCEATYARAV